VSDGSSLKSLKPIWWWMDLPAGNRAGRDYWNGFS